MDNDIHNRIMAYCHRDTTPEIIIHCHNLEWGKPLLDGRGQFEFLMAEEICGYTDNE